MVDPEDEVTSVEIVAIDVECVTLEAKLWRAMDAGEHDREDVSAEGAKVVVSDDAGLISRELDSDWLEIEGGKIVFD